MNSLIISEENIMNQENEKNKYKIGDYEVILSRHWVDIDYLKDIANEFNYDSPEELEQVLKSNGVDIEEGKADFTQINIFLLERGVISTEFLNLILNNWFDIQEHYYLADLLILLGEIELFGEGEEQIQLSLESL